MNLYYLGHTYIEKEIPSEISYRNIITLNASRKRENYIFRALLNLNGVNKFEYVSFGLGHKNGIVREHIFVNNLYSSTYLSYFGFSKLKILSGYLQAIIFLFTKIKSGDIVLSYNFHPGYAIPLLILKKLKKISIIIEYEDFFNENDWRHYFFGPFEFLGIKLADGFIASSVGMKNYIKEKRREAKILINSGYIINNSEGVNPKILNKCDKIRLLYSGSLDKERGIENLIHSFIDNCSDKFELYITGDGELSTFVKNLSLLNPNIIYKGIVDDKILFNLIDGVDACFNPQWSNISINFPSKTTFYFSFGKFVISTNNLSLMESPFKDLFMFYDDSVNSSFKMCIDYLETNLIHIRESQNLRINHFQRIMKNQEKELCEFISMFCK